MVPIFTVITGALKAKTVAKFVQIRGHFSSRLWPNQCSTEIDLKQAAMLKAEIFLIKIVPVVLQSMWIHLEEQQGN